MSEADPNLTTADSGPASMMASIPSATDSRGKYRFIYFSCVLSVKIMTAWILLQLVATNITVSLIRGNTMVDRLSVDP